MKKTLTLLLGIVCTCLFMCCDKLPEDQAESWYGIEKGVIEYGDLGTLYFEDFGKQERYVMQNGDVLLYLIDKTIQLFPKTKEYKIMIEMEKSYPSHYFGDENSWLWAGQFKATKQEMNVLDKPCVVWVGSVNGKETKYGGWNRIIFIYELQETGDYTATSIAEELPDGNLFGIPDDYTERTE